MALRIADTEVLVMRKRFGYNRSMESLPNVANIAALIAEPARAAILNALLDGRAWTATELSIEAGVTPQTTSGHLANYDYLYDVTAKDAIGMGIDRVEHWITLEDGSEKTSELKAMIEIFLQHGTFFDANLQMYGEGKLRNDPNLDMVWHDESQYFTPPPMTHT